MTRHRSEHSDFPLSEMSHRIADHPGLRLCLTEHFVEPGGRTILPDSEISKLSVTELPFLNRSARLTPVVSKNTNETKTLVNGGISDRRVSALIGNAR